MFEKLEASINSVNGIDLIAPVLPGKRAGRINWSPKRIQAAKRLKSIIVVAQFRSERSLAIDPKAFARAIARTLIEAPAGPYDLGKRFVALKWFGLTLESLRMKLDQAGIGGLSTDWLCGLIHNLELQTIADNGHTALSDAALGAMIELTAAEREICGVILIEACDESREERLTRGDAPRRAAEAARKRASRGRQSRAEYVAQRAMNSAQKARPWETLGVSRATFYRTREK